MQALLPVARDVDLARRSRCEVGLDRTQTIRASVHDVENTLVLSVVLVVLVVFVFLRTGRATRDPERRRAALARRHVRGDVPARLQPSTTCR